VFNHFTDDNEDLQSADQPAVRASGEFIFIYVLSLQTVRTALRAIHKEQLTSSYGLII
jgi:hypothetical protein